MCVCVRKSPPIASCGWETIWVQYSQNVELFVVCCQSNLCCMQYKATKWWRRRADKMVRSAWKSRKPPNVNRFTWEINYMQTQTCSMFQPVCTNATQVLSRPYKVYALIHSLTVWMWLDVAGICRCPFPTEQQTCWISKVHRAWGIQQITGWDQHLAEKKIVDSSKVNHLYYLYLYYIYV